MSFDFEAWSEEVYELIDSIELAKERGEDHKLQEERLHALWSILLKQEQNESIDFLKSLLDKARGLVNGKLERREYNQFMQEARIHSVVWEEK